MKVHPAEQGSLEWLAARAGIPTASEFDQLLTAKFEARKGEMPRTYLARKLAERWLGSPIMGGNTLDMEWGKILEEEARPGAAFDYNLDIQPVGLVTTDDGKIGASPDGLIGEDSGIEIKCPGADKHVKYLLSGVVPDDYLLQVHGSMFVTGRATWRFMSYRRHFPSLMLIVERDEKIVDIIGKTLAQFVEHLDEAWNQLCTINGGPPKRHAPMPQPQPEPELEDFRH